SSAASICIRDRSYLYKESTPNAAEIFAETPELAEWLQSVTISSLADDSLPATISARDYTPGTYRGERFDVNCRIKTKKGVDVTSSINFDIVGSVTVKADNIDFEVTDVTLPYKENKNQSSVVGYTFDELKCLNVLNPKSGVTIENYRINEVSYGGHFPNLSQAGEYDISFDINASGYEACRASVHVTITPFPAYMTFTRTLSKIYDGSPVDVSLLVKSSASGFNGEVSDLIITYYELILENGAYHEEVLESAPTDVGKYSVHIISSRDLEEGVKNYTTLDISQIFEITAKEIKLEINEDMELLNDELLNKSWSSKQYQLNAGDNKYIMSGDLLQFQFSTEVFERGKYVASQILKVNNSSLGIVEGSNTSDIITESGKKFTISWRLVSTDSKGNILYQEIVDPNSTDPDNPTMLQIPYDVSSNYYITLSFKMNVHYPYIPVTIEGVECEYDGESHYGSIEFGGYTSADTTISYPADWFATNATQLYSQTQDYLTNSPELCLTDIESVSFVDPGNYTIYYKIDVKDSATSTKFEPVIGSYVIRIDKLERTVVETQSLNKEFNNVAAGQNRSGRYFPYYAVSHADESIPDEYSLDDVSIVYKQAGLNAEIDPTIGCVDSGVYIYSLTIPETKYYKQSVLPV
ncbi:MAG: hypothetical protein K2J85_01030, partial [Anaeroplasmataceae bacterium]|nr:hypothetical protein [Anaeroplasmataceae bacterium]